MNRRRPAGDRGAAAIIVVILFSTFMLGIGAVVTDAGSLYAERAQLQNGADAAAFAMADTCASSAGCPAQVDTTTGATQTAIDHANSNANDNTAKVDYVCGGTPTGGTLPGLKLCSSAVIPGWTPTGCPPLGSILNGAAGYVDVHTSTKDLSNSDPVKLKPLIGKALLGDSYAGQNVKTCARAAWGSPGGATTIPLAISKCEWIKDTGYNPPNPPTFAAAPPYLAAPANTPLPPAYPQNTYDPTVFPVPGGEGVLAFHGTANTLTGGDFDSTPFNGFSTTPNGNNGPSLSLNTDPAFIHDGAGSGQIIWNTDASTRESVDYTGAKVTAATDYVLSAWVYVPAGQPSVQLYLANPSRAAPVYSPTPPQSGDSTWHQLSIPFTASGATVDFGLASVAPTLNGALASVYIDTVVLRLKTAPECVGAPNPPSGFDQPGGFGWLYDPNGNCSVVVNVKNTIPDNTGASLDPTCPTILQNHSCTYATIHAGPPPTCQPQALFVAVYDGLCSNSGSCNVSDTCGPLPPQSNGCYHIEGFAEFVPTGFQLNGGGGGLKQNSTLSNQQYCKGTNQCVYGFFIQKLVQFAGTFGPPNSLGAPVVALTN